MLIELIRNLRLNILETWSWNSNPHVCSVTNNFFSCLLTSVLNFLQEMQMWERDRESYFSSDSKNCLSSSHKKHSPENWAVLLNPATGWSGSDQSEGSTSDLSTNEKSALWRSTNETPASEPEPGSLNFSSTSSTKMSNSFASNIFLQPFTNAWAAELTTATMTWSGDLQETSSTSDWSTTETLPPDWLILLMQGNSPAAGLNVMVACLIGLGLKQMLSSVILDLREPSEILLMLITDCVIRWQDDTWVSLADYVSDLLV